MTALPAETLRELGPVSHLPTVAAPMDIVRAALATGNIEMYREAVALAKDMDAFAARKAFDNAMADAKAAIPTIRKNREVDSGERNGKQGPKYRFEDLAEIARTIDPILGEHGLSYRFKVSSEVNQPVRVTCVVSHRAGHFEETTLTSGRDDGPGRNAIQQIGSTITYLQRYTLKAALGLAASHDDDGSASERTRPVEYVPSPGSITEDQAANLREALEAKDASEKAFLQWAASKGHLSDRKHLIAEIPADRYDACMAAIAGFKKG